MKHLITCRCVLPQFKRMASPPVHQFTTFSVLDDAGAVVPKFTQCNNCGIVHKVTEINRSVVVPKESMGSIITIDDVKLSMPPKLAAVLETNGADVATWEMARFIVENRQWGGFVVLQTDEEDGMRQGKYVRIIGDDLFKVESFTREERPA